MNVSEALIREIVTKVLEESAGKGGKPEFEKHIDPSGIIGIKTSTVKCEPFQQDGVKLKDVVTLEEAPRMGCGIMELRDGADFRKIDKVMEKQFGWPMGPAYLLDVVGIDTAHHAQAVMAAGFPQRMQKDYRDAIDALFDANRFGQKNGLGFWRYKEDSKGKPKKEEDAVVDDLLAEVSQPKRDFSEEEIIARMMIPMVNEVVRCLEEGIIATPAEADMALVYGLGFPPFHGGAFRWLDTLGSAKYLDMAQQYQHLGPLYEVPEGLRNKARHNEPYYPPVEPARPVGDLKTA